ncbi:hypothetical protein [Fimbriimonas ginsengisoli]|uniref:Uncharacterized protein n=1 Tax=Fimbriimonas ginsengisoli Gsoil 348 TaxID=661478 RepID=A0A068NM54_FIMGI|nr:hypothetical protein [Fimbriimonas ginsengisoli]AIE84638.1 hypothetical protein OP10G_1270 [Fimbriimonas ginsengisoli Gsoil 348]
MFAPLLAIAAVFQAAPADTAWSKADRGLTFGLSITAKSDGPDLIRCFVKNDNDLPVTLYIDRSIELPKPVYTLKSEKGMMWQLKPATATPMVWGGPPPLIYLPPHATTLVHASRSWFPLVAGKYEVTAGFVASRQDYGLGRPEALTASFTSATAILTIKPGDVQPTMASGSGYGSWTGAAG